MGADESGVDDPAAVVEEEERGRYSCRHGVATTSGRRPLVNEALPAASCPVGLRSPAVRGLLAPLTTVEQIEHGALQEG